MRYVFFVIIVALLPGLALAETGHQAKYSIQFNLSAEMRSALAQQGTDATAMSDFAPPSLTGQMWWTTGSMKMTLAFPAMGPDSEPFDGTMLLDIANQVVYMLDPSTKEASKIDLNNPSQAGMAPGMMGINPSELTGDWSKDISRIDATEYATVKKLSQTTLNGMVCEHYTFEIDTTKLPADTAMLDENMSMIDMLGTYGGEAWVSQETGMPIKIAMSIMGLDVIYQLSDLKDWTPTADAFKVPAGYTVTVPES